MLSDRVFLVRRSLREFVVLAALRLYFECKTVTFSAFVGGSSFRDVVEKYCGASVGAKPLPSNDDRMHSK